MQEENLIPISELCIYHDIEMSFIHSLQEYGLIEVISQEENIFISTGQLSEFEKLVRMHYELNINMEGIDVVCQLLKRLEAARQEVSDLKNQLKFYNTL